MAHAKCNNWYEFFLRYKKSKIIAMVIIVIKKMCFSPKDYLYFDTTLLSLHLSPCLTHTKEFLVIPNNEIVVPHAATDFYLAIED